MRRSLIVLGLLSFACGYQKPPSPYYEVYLAPDLTDEQVQATRFAMQEWERTTQLVQFEETDNPDDYGPVITIRPMPHSDRFIGVCQHSLGENEQILIDPNQNYLTDRVIMLHEFGHCLGLPHLGPGTLMFPTTGDNNAGRITCTDLKEFCNIWDCDANKLPTCEN